MRRSLGATVALAATVLTACGAASPARSGAPRSITVSAAASLTDAFQALGREFARAHRGVRVRFDFGASSTLAVQIAQGAPVDVFASADEAHMRRLTRAGLVDGAPRVFARNELEIVTKPGNPLHVRALADLARAGVVSLCAAGVPCGDLADEVLRRAGVEIPASRVTRGQDVKGTLTAVSVGDADAGIVYVTDVLAAARGVGGVAIPGAQNAVTALPIAVVRGTRDAPAAKAFVAYVTSPAGERTLARFGFRAP